MFFGILRRCQRGSRAQLDQHGAYRGSHGAVFWGTPRGAEKQRVTNVETLGKKQSVHIVNSLRLLEMAASGLPTQQCYAPARQYVS